MVRRIFKFASVLIVVFIGLILSMVTNVLILKIFPENYELFGTIISTIGTIIVCLLGLFIASKIDDKNLKEYGIIWHASDSIKLLIGLVIGVTIFVLSTFPLYITHIYILNNGNHDIWILITGFVSFVATGVIEELVFRGFLFHRLSNFNPMIALIVSSTLFSLLHSTNPGITSLGLINLFLFGLFLALMIYIFKSIAISIGIHITWNWAQGSLLGIPVSGTLSNGFFNTNIITNHSVLITGGDFGAESSIFITILLIILCLILIVFSFKMNQ
ncbi:CPBP family intramembrane metalloprotease [Enterococcus faecalis]|uniref:CPBP family intramembrane glutamic endopeptidase n=2 Tax=Enterococcus faecalis TaxID=1351 RepID=UPI001A0D08EF|nr:CPBP family intramembrane metalloprotease [Enterococcus faecalis]HAP3648600.1 CPBP family intramembrane metalloprotease [Enterococcus faecalis]